jgi:hypothetical protein
MNGHWPFSNAFLTFTERSCDVYLSFCWFSVSHWLIWLCQPNFHSKIKFLLWQSWVLTQGLALARQGLTAWATQPVPKVKFHMVIIYIFLMCSLIWFANILLRIFASLFINCFPLCVCLICVSGWCLFFELSSEVFTLFLFFWKS